MKIKNYTIMLSQRFPVTHPRAGAETNFISSFIHGRGCKWCPNNAWCDEICVTLYKKLHTIRANYELWKKRIEAVQRGEAVINIRVWNGKPYRSKTTLIATLTAEDGIGIQKMTIAGCSVFHPIYVGGSPVSVETLAHNDGLSFEDWRDWFSGYDLTEPLAVIHFTKFRY